MGATLTIDSSGFRRAIGGLLQFSGQDLRPIIRAEVGSILKACVGDTKVATYEEIELRERVRTLHELGLTAEQGSMVQINVGIRGAFGKVWRTTGYKRTEGARAGRRGVQQTHDAGMKPLWRHYGEAAWSEVRTAVSRFREALRLRVPAAKKSQGLSRQSWVQIADDAGIRLESVPGGGASAAAIAKARAAISSNGVRFQNGQAREYLANKSFVIELINRLPWGRKMQLDTILIRNINARARYYQENLSRGVFDKLSTIAKRYPGLRISAS